VTSSAAELSKLQRVEAKEKDLAMPKQRDIQARFDAIANEKAIQQAIGNQADTCALHIGVKDAMGVKAPVENKPMSFNATFAGLRMAT
jgi:hypothetical protein